MKARAACLYLFTQIPSMIFVTCLSSCFLTKKWQYIAIKRPSSTPKSTWSIEFVPLQIPYRQNRMMKSRPDAIDNVIENFCLFVSSSSYCLSFSKQCRPAEKLNAIAFMASVPGLPNSNSQAQGKILLDHMKGLPSWKQNFMNEFRKIPRESMAVKQKAVCLDAKLNSIMRNIMYDLVSPKW